MHKLPQVISIPSRRVGDLPSTFPASFPVDFHPLKAGRRRCIFVPTFRLVGYFHPLKAGRRPEPSAKQTISELYFHPLKAGRRLRGIQPFYIGNRDFHPLKAGRRRVSCERAPCKVPISIPSRRVGDITAGVVGGSPILFPSPQGGSETRGK